MKNFIQVALVGMFLIGFSTMSFAQADSKASAATSATIVTPISVAQTQDMNFGNLEPGTGGTLVLATDGSRTATSGVTLPAIDGSPTAASFAVTGEANLTFSIAFTNATFDVTSGSNTMSVGTIVNSFGATGTLDGTGAATIDVGATLTVGSNQAAGTYTNSNELEVTVAYN